MPRAAVKFIPWDASDAQHVDRLTIQRVHCGWNEDKVPEWKEAQLKGSKCFYWLVNI